jgi:dihydrodipicolinate synthase/N-acetylneuraminate lyase
MIDAHDIQGMYAIIPTPAKQGAERLDALDTVDLDQTNKMVNKLIDDGATGLIALGTTGECATLSEADYDTFAACVVETVNRRVPTFLGATAMGGHQSVRRLRYISELGADGALLGLPMWQPVTLPMAVEYYGSVSELFPELALMVYANARAFRFSFPPEFWTALLRAAPTATSAKYSKVEGLPELVSSTEGRINFVPNEMQVHRFYEVVPESTTACWATSSGMNPKPAVALMQAIKVNDRPAINTLAAAIAWANEPIRPIVDNPEIFAQYNNNIQMEKTRINAAGYSSCGPTRPPYQHFPEEYAAASRECGRRWAQICAAYRGDSSFEPAPWTGVVAYSP